MSNPATVPFWAAAAEGRLVLPRCLDCGHLQWTPQPACPRCLGERLDWFTCSGNGVLYSSTVVHRSPDQSEHPVPYTVAVVTLDEGPSMLTRLRPGAATSRYPGAPVRVVFTEVDGRHLYEFEVCG
jgi:uncharacterized OB-fold protein